MLLCKALYSWNNFVTVVAFLKDILVVHFQILYYIMFNIQSKMWHDFWRLMNYYECTKLLNIETTNIFSLYLPFPFPLSLFPFLSYPNFLHSWRLKLELYTIKEITLPLATPQPACVTFVICLSSLENPTKWLVISHSLLFHFKSIYLFIYLLCVCVYLHVRTHHSPCWKLKDNCRNWFSASIMWTFVIELRLSGMVVDPFTFWAILQTPCYKKQCPLLLIYSSVFHFH